MEYMEGRDEWVGMAGQLLDDLDRHVGEKTLNHKMWPKDAPRLGKQLKLISSFLRKMGIEIEYLKKTRKGQQILIRSTKANKT